MYIDIYIYIFIYTVYIVTGVIFCLTGTGDLLAPLLGNTLPLSVSIKSVTGLDCWTQQVSYYSDMSDWVLCGYFRSSLDYQSPICLIGRIPF